jgi:phage tail protein X
VLILDELWEILRKNRARISANISATLKANIQAHYEPNLATVLPIKERLRRTDELIDQIVYRLYGLTDAEVAVVEGHE